MPVWAAVHCKDPLSVGLCQIDAGLEQHQAASQTQVTLCHGPGADHQYHAGITVSKRRRCSAGHQHQLLLLLHCCCCTASRAVLH